MSGPMSEKKSPPGTVDNATASAQNNGNSSAVEKVSNDQPATVLDVENPDKLKGGDDMPNPEEEIEALGIPNWRELEKQVVRRLDMTLMPCLWVLYLFNYLDRASIA